MNKIEKKIKEISDLKIQGATNVAMSGLDIALLISKNKKNKKTLINEISRLESKILKSRPTEPLLINFYSLLIQAIMNFKGRGIDLPRFVEQKIKEIKNFYRNKEEKIVKKGSKLITKGNIFTHCHSSLVEKILISSQKQGHKFKVYNTETRPLFQGRITAKNLNKNKIDVTLVADSAAPFLVSNHSGDKIIINKVILGADVVSLDGSAVNKIGSFGIALTACESGIPVYVATSLMKVDKNSKRGVSIKLENREAREIWPRYPRSLKVANFAFDIIPSKFITGFITEEGIIKPKMVKKVIEKKYPCLL